MYRIDLLGGIWHATKIDDLYDEVDDIQDFISHIGNPVVIVENLEDFCEVFFVEKEEIGVS